MFRRKDEEMGESPETNDLLSQADDDNIDTSATVSSSSASEEKATPAAAPAAPAAAPAAAAKPAAPAPASSFRPQAAPNLAQNRPPAAATAASAPAAASASPKASKRILTVGHDIHMKGEIATCDRLVIEGSVDAELKDVHTVELAESGAFKGTAEIEDAEISGIFEGDLIVNGRLIIYSTGRVSGNIAYGEIEIERGGQLSGNIKTADEIKSGAKAPSAKKAA